MKLLTLLSKMANAEHLPSNIIYDNDIWHYQENENDYWSDCWLVAKKLNDSVICNWWNDDIKIIEKEKPIKHLDIKEQNNQCWIGNTDYLIEQKINELVDEVNILKGVDQL